MEILPVGADLFHADRQTDRHDEAEFRFPQFYESFYKRICSINCIRGFYRNSRIKKKI